MTVGSACSGWDSEVFALEELGISHTLSFACDNDSKVERLAHVLRTIKNWYPLHGSGVWVKGPCTGPSATTRPLPGLLGTRLGVERSSCYKSVAGRLRVRLRIGRKLRVESSASPAYTELSRPVKATICFRCPSVCSVAILAQAIRRELAAGRGARGLAMEAGAQEGEIQQGLEAAQKLLEAVVKAGGSRHVVATVAAALRRLTTLPGRAAECSSDEAAAPAQCFRILEEALEAVRQLAGGGRRLNISGAKEVLRQHGSAGCSLASRLGKVSRVRNAHAHPEVGLAAEIGQLRTSGGAVIQLRPPAALDPLVAADPWAQGLAGDPGLGVSQKTCRGPQPAGADNAEDDFHSVTSESASREGPRALDAEVAEFCIAAPPLSWEFEAEDAEDRAMKDVRREVRCSMDEILNIKREMEVRATMDVKGEDQYIKDEVQSIRRDIDSMGLKLDEATGLRDLELKLEVDLRRMESRMDEKLKIDFGNVKYELETSLKQVYGVLGTKVDNVAWWDANDCLEEKLKFDFDNVKYELGELKIDFDNVKCEVSFINDLKKVSVDSRLNVDGINMSIEQGIEEVTALNGHFAGKWADASGEVENDKPDDAVDGDVEPEEELNVEQSVAKSDFEPRVDKTVDTAFAASVLAREVGCQAGKRRRRKPVSGINHVVTSTRTGRSTAHRREGGGERRERRGRREGQHVRGHLCQGQA